ncbi:MAG: hypothetical protein ISS77_04005 [Phycisphaerae bacterium]|nr:hypothetical protein [Phycisphaerae bacterium]
MGGWKSKLIFMMVIYFAGFGTAIYTLSPSPEGIGGNNNQIASISSQFSTGKFTDQVNIGMHKFISIAKKAAMKSGGIIEKQMNSNSPES